MTSARSHCRPGNQFACCRFGFLLVTGLFLPESAAGDALFQDEETKLRQLVNEMP